jgi:choice-of-anchor C domain-containing protein
VAATSGAGKNLVVNGSFERRKSGRPNSGIETLAPTSDLLLGWEVIDHDAFRDDGRPWTIDWIGPKRWRASQGEHCLDLDGGVRQILPTIAGHRYVLSFDLAGNPELGPFVQQLRVMLDECQHEFEFDSIGKTKEDLGWVTKQVLFTARRNRTLLTFINAKPTAQSAGVALDRVVVRRQIHPDANPLRELYARMRRFEREAEDLRRQGRSVEADQHAHAAARYRNQFEEMLGLPDDPETKD